MKHIVTIPNTILSTPARPVTFFDKRLARLIREIKETLISTKNPKGVGLAAPQIGEPFRVFAMRPTIRDPIRIFINPEILELLKERTDGVPGREHKLEGCLSIPRIWGKVKRAASLKLAFQDETGQRRTEEFHGFPATIIQHETDHVNGILFTQRVLEQKGTLYQTAKDAEGKEVLKEIELT